MRGSCEPSLQLETGYLPATILTLKVMAAIQ